MELIRCAAPSIIEDNLGRPVVRFEIRSPSGTSVALLLDCPARDRQDALEIVLRNRTAAEAPLLLEEERLAQCRISTEWGSLAQTKRLVSGYDGLRFLEFRRFWDQPIPPAWLQHYGKTGLGVTEPRPEEGVNILWEIGDGLTLASFVEGDRHPLIQRQLRETVFAGFVRCRGELYLVSERPSLFALAADEAMVLSAIEPRLEGWKWLAQTFRLIDSLAREGGQEAEEEPPQKSPPEGEGS
ncbi:MAG: hypothetical protein ACLQME_14655 [Alphaproteobacteria bacterium]